MTKRRHCDLCDGVIDDEIRYLSVTASIDRGEEQLTDGYCYHVCLACCRQHSVMQRFVDELVEDYKDALGGDG